MSPTCSPTLARSSSPAKECVIWKNRASTHLSKCGQWHVNIAQPHFERYQTVYLALDMDFSAASDIRVRNHETDLQVSTYLLEQLSRQYTRRFSSLCKPRSELWPGKQFLKINACSSKKSVMEADLSVEILTSSTWMIAQRHWRGAEKWVVWKMPRCYEEMRKFAQIRIY